MTLPLPSHPLAVDTDVADYAVGLAYATHLRGEDAALELLAIDREAWERARAWPERLAAAVGSGDMALVGTFGTAFNATRAELAAVLAASAPAVETPPVDVLAQGILATLSNEAAAAPERFVVDPAGPAEPRQVSVAPDTVPMDASPSTDARPAVVIPPALPFDRRGPAALAAAALQETAPAVVVSRANYDGEATVEAPVPAMLRAALPFGQIPDTVNSGPPPEPVFAAMSVEQYASLCASLEAFPEKAKLILQRYGIAQPSQLQRLHEGWQVKFAGDPTSRAAWQRQLADIRARLRDAK